MEFLLCWLEDEGACEAGLAFLRSFNDDHASLETALDAAPSNYLEWTLSRTGDPAWEEYLGIRGAAWAKCEMAREAAYVEYEKIRDAAWAEYNKTVCNVALGEYRRVCGAAWAEYNAMVHGPALTEYMRVCDAAVRRFLRQWAGF